MGKVRHEAFLDLEETLAKRLRNGWARYWAPLAGQIQDRIDRGDWDSAHKLAESIDLGPLFERSRTFARTVGMSALLLGASRLRSIRNSRIAKQPPKRELDSFLSQMHTMLARNATDALRKLAHEWITEEEQRLAKYDPSQPRDERGRWTGGSWTTPDADTVDTYSYGKCMWFALAAHERFGWPMEALLDSDGSISHAWVRAPDGRTFDVAGFNGPEDYIQFDPRGVHAYTKEGLLARVEGGYDQQEISKATKLIEEHWKSPVVKLDTGADRNQIKINVAGKQYFALAASVQVSRLSAFGFLLEGAESGQRNYRIDAVLDARTCEVCKHLDGWVFPMDAGLRQAQLIMDTDDPDALKQIAPFYAQTKASLLELATYGTDDLIDMGMLLPPFHPLCRCILTPTDEASDVHPTQVSDRVALASQALYGAGDGARLTRELFGIEEPSEEASRRLGDVVPDLTPEEEAVPEWLVGLITESGTAPPPAEEAAGWIQDLVTDWLAQPAANAPPPPLVTPNPFEGTTIPQQYAEPFSPARLRQVAEMRWPWLAGILGWLALGRRDQFEAGETEADLIAEEELAEIERDERNELREERRR